MAIEPRGSEANVLLANSGKFVAILICGLAAAIAFMSIAEGLGAGAQGIRTTIFGAIFFLLLVIGWASRTRDAAEFYVASHRVPPFVNALAALGGWLAVPAFAGLAGHVFTFGFDGLAFVVGPLAGVLVAGVLFQPYLAASKASTVSEFLGLRFGPAARVMSAAVIACVSFVVFAAALSAAAELAARVFEVPTVVAAVAALILILLMLVPGGMISLTWTAAVIKLIGLIAILAGLIVMGKHGFGQNFPPLASAQALQSITDLEYGMIEKGLADAALLKPQAKPFLQIDPANFFGLILSLMMATAVLPQLLQRSIAVQSPAAARSSSAWLLALAAVVMTSASAWALFGKYEVYALVEKGTAFAAVPDWLATSPGGIGVQIHGISILFVEDVVAAVQSGAQTSSQVADALTDRGDAAAASWGGLKEPLKVLMIQTAQSAPPGAGADYALQALRTTIWPAAALSAGNKTGLITLASLKFDAEALMLGLPKVMGASATIASLSIAAALSGLLAIASAALFSVAAVLSRDVIVSRSQDRADVASIGDMRWARAWIIVAGLTAAAAVTLLNVDWTAAAALAVSAGASALFAVMAGAIWWPRANSLGAALAVLSGLAVSLIYGAGTRYFPVALFDLWPAASDALPAATAKLAAMKSAPGAASGDQAAALAAKLQAYAGGTPFKPGVANWWGLGGASAVVFALPVAILALLLGRLLGPAPSPAQRAFVETFRRPGGVDDGSSTVL